MKKFSTKLLKIICIFVAGSVLSISTVKGQTYPNKPITMIAGFPPGGSADLLARMVSQKLSIALNQSILVENRTGAGGTIAASVVAKAIPDGYTLFLGSAATQSIAPAVYKNLSYQSPQAFQPITMVAQIPVALVVNPGIQVNTVQELLTLAKNQKDPLTFASSGTGAVPHLAGELFQQSTGIKLTHIPYKGAPLAMTDLISGRVNMMFDNLPTVLPHIRGGKLRVLAIAGSKQTRALPNVPTLAELGIKGAEVTSWFGVLAPNGLPMPIAKRLNDEIVKIFSTNEVKDQLFEMGAEPFVLTSDEFVKFLDGDIKRWAKLVRDANVQGD